MTSDEKTVKKRWKEYSAQQMSELADVLEGIEDFSVEGQEPIVLKWVEDKGYKLGDIMNAFRLTLVGIGKGPGMFDISAFLGNRSNWKFWLIMESNNRIHSIKHTFRNQCACSTVTFFGWLENKTNFPL